MTSKKKTMFITGAGRGMGFHIAQAALAAGHNVVATGRNPDAVREALGPADDLLAVKLDVTSTQDAEAAVTAAVDRFGGIDVLVNNAANFYAGYFEELTAEQMERQLAASLVGPIVNPGFFRTELLTIADQEQPPRRFIAGADAIGTAEQQIAALQHQIDAFRVLSSSLAIDEAAAGS
jgi:short-subunit dehydrogenase involved in D-alanine esterification of teichoic acids